MLVVKYLRNTNTTEIYLCNTNSIEFYLLIYLEVIGVVLEMLADDNDGRLVELKNKLLQTLN